jgi:hypothetical protein
MENGDHWGHILLVGFPQGHRLHWAGMEIAQPLDDGMSEKECIIGVVPLA